MPVWINVPISTVSEASLLSRAMTLAAVGLPNILPEVTETFPDPDIKFHVDFLEENYYEKYRLDMLRKYKRPGEYNFFDLTDEIWNTFECKHRHNPALHRCRSPIYICFFLE